VPPVEALASARRHHLSILPTRVRCSCTDGTPRSSSIRSSATSLHRRPPDGIATIRIASARRPDDPTRRSRSSTPRVNARRLFRGPGTNRRLNRHPQRRPLSRGGEWPLDPARAVQDGRLVVGAYEPSLRKSPSSRRHSTTFWGIPCFRWASRFPKRSAKGVASAAGQCRGAPVGASRPCLEIGEVRGQGPPRVLARAPTGEMFQGLDIVGEQLSQLVPPVHLQDGGELHRADALAGFPDRRRRGEGRGVRSVMIPLRLFPGGYAVDGTEIAARTVGAPAASASWRPGGRRRQLRSQIRSTLWAMTKTPLVSGPAPPPQARSGTFESSPCAPAKGAATVMMSPRSVPHMPLPLAARPSPKRSLGSRRKRPRDPDPFRPRCAAQLPVEGDERQSALLRKRHIDGVIGAEPRCDRDR
jgi:hypothetical protein